MLSAAAKPEGRCRILLVSSPKGGSGKSVISRHLLVSAAQDGFHALGLDFDRQQTLAKWASRRARTREAFPEFAETLVESASLQDWRSALRRINGYQLAILDTPPSVEDHLPAIEALGEAADLIIVPAVCTQDDVESVAPWVKAGSVCPTELPQLEDIHVPSTKGLTLLDYSKSRGIEPFEEIWAYVRREV